MLGKKFLLIVPAAVLIGLLGLVIAPELTQTRGVSTPLDVSLLVRRLIPADTDLTELSEEDIEAITSCAREMMERWNGVGYYNTTKDPAPDEVIYVSGERISIWGCPGKLIIYKFGGGPEKPDEFREFVRRRIYLLKALAEGVPEYKIKAWVSPVKPLTDRELEELVARYGLELITTTFKYTRSDTGEYVATGGGVGPWLTPPEHRLKALQEELLPPGVKLEYRIVAFGVASAVESLLKLQNDPMILLVDVGPLDILYHYVQQGALVFLIGPERRMGDHLLTYARLANIDPYELKEYANKLLNG